jgi:hypothetical protein
MMSIDIAMMVSHFQVFNIHFIYSMRTESDFGPTVLFFRLIYLHDTLECIESVAVRYPAVINTAYLKCIFDPLVFILIIHES